MKKEIFKGNYISVTTEDRNGAVYEQAYRRSGVMVIPVTKDRCVRFIKEKLWYLPEKVTTKVMAGFINDGEEPLACARRELAEELGLKAENWKLLTLFESRGAVNFDNHIFVASGLEDCPTKPDKEEDIVGFEDVPIASLKKRVLNGEFGVETAAFALLKFLEEKS